MKKERKETGRKGHGKENGGKMEGIEGELMTQGRRKGLGRKI